MSYVECVSGKHGMRWFSFAAPVVFVGVCSAICAMWLTPGVSWLHPEVAGAAFKIWSRGDLSMGERLAYFFQWENFDRLPHRLRIVSEFFETIDAIIRPTMMSIYRRPAFSLTGALYVVATPIVFFRILRAYDIERPAALIGVALLITTTGFLSNAFVFFRPAKPLSFLLLALTLLWLARRPVGLPGIVSLASVLLVGLFTDELLFLSVPFVLVAAVTVKALSVSRALLVACIVICSYALLAFVAVPWLYSLANVSRALLVTTSDPVRSVPAMLTLLLRPDFLLAAASVSARSLATTLGLITASPILAGVYGVFLLVFLALIAWFWRMRQTKV